MNSDCLARVNISIATSYVATIWIASMASISSVGLMPSIAAKPGIHFGLRWKLGTPLPHDSAKPAYRLILEGLRLGCGNRVCRRKATMIASSSIDRAVDFGCFDESVDRPRNCVCATWLPFSD